MLSQREFFAGNKSTIVQLIKLGLISIVFLFLVITGISLLIPSHIRLSKAINMGGTNESILYYVRNKNTWPQWHPAFMQDTSNRNSNLVITPRLDNDSEVLYQMQLPGKRPIMSGWKVYHHASTDSLTLQWYMDFHLPWYPWQKFGSLLYEGTYGRMMEQGLNNLKKLSNN
jgi:hypothetical protein